VARARHFGPQQWRRRELDGGLLMARLQPSRSELPRFLMHRPDAATGMVKECAVAGPKKLRTLSGIFFRPRQANRAPALAHMLIRIRY
jgi:hypothetical protein